MEKNTKKFQMIGFGDRINALCKDRGITIKQLERELGIANGYVRHVEVRGTTPSIERIDLFANYFGVSRDYIVGKEIQTTPAQASTGVLIPLVGRVAAGLPITAVENVIGQEHMPDAYIQERGGWSTDFVMKNVYRHTFDDVRTAEQQKINQAFVSLIPEDKKSPPDAHTDNRG